MSLKVRIEDDIKAAMKAGDSERLGVLRMVKTALLAAEKDNQTELTDDDVMRLLQKELKQRQDTKKVYEDASETERAAKEQAEIDILQDYLPEQMGDDELAKLVEDTIAATGASGVQDMGRVMGELKSKLGGRADPSKVAGLVKDHLSQ